MRQMQLQRMQNISRGLPVADALPAWLSMEGLLSMDWGLEGTWTMWWRLLTRKMVEARLRGMRRDSRSSSSSAAKRSRSMLWSICPSCCRKHNPHGIHTGFHHTQITYTPVLQFLELRLANLLPIAGDILTFSAFALYMCAWLPDGSLWCPLALGIILSESSQNLPGSQH